MNAAQQQQDACTPAETEAYYESVASEEELYLERIEEHLRVMLTATPAAAAHRPACESKGDAETIADAARDLIAGDADDAPLREETVAERLKQESRARSPRIRSAKRTSARGFLVPWIRWPIRGWAPSAAKR